MKRIKHGLTLIELVVVVVILGILAAMLLPKFEGLQSAAGHASSAASAGDLARLIGTYKASKLVYPDKWDSLMSGTGLWAPGNVATSTKGLHLELSDPTTGKLLTTAITSTQATAFQKVGISTLMNLTSASTLRPGDMFSTPATLADGSTVAVVSPTNGKKIIDHIYRANQLSTGTSGTLPSGTQLVVFGVGPQNALVPNSMMEPPVYSNANGTYIYNRLLAVFEMTASKVTFKGILGSDGDLIDDMAVNMQTTTGL